MSYRVVDGGALVLEDAAEELADAEAIVFDCDGTLVDVSGSFKMVGKLVTIVLLDQLYGVECRLGDDFDEAFQLLKMLGGFNNVRNVTMILLQAIFVNAGASKPKKRKMEKVDIEYYSNNLIRGNSRPDFAKEALRWIISMGVEKLGAYVTGDQLELLIEDEAKRLGAFEQLKEFRRLIGPIYPYGSGAFTTLFSEFWLGSEGIERRHGVKPRLYEGKGLIENERLIVKPSILEQLRDLAPKGLAILSGRGKWVALKALRPVLEYFRIDASVFTGDWPRRMDKPNPVGLMECCKKLEASKIIYVGDGGEDLFLTREASKLGVKAHLAGLLTNKYSYAFFTKQRAEAILENVNFLPKLFKSP